MSVSDAPATVDRDLLHALSNHLCVILGFIDLVLEGTGDDDPHRRELLEIRRAAVQAGALLGRNLR